MRWALRTIRIGWAIGWSAFAFLILAYALPRWEGPCPGLEDGGGAGGAGVPVESLDILCVRPLITVPILALIAAGLAVWLWHLLHPIVGGEPRSVRMGRTWVTASLVAVVTLLWGTFLVAFPALPGNEAAAFLAAVAALVAGDLLAATYRRIFTQ